MPVAAHAASRTTWSFLGSQIGSEWRINGKAKTTAEIGGLRIAPEEDTKIFRETQFSHAVDSVEITYLSLQETPSMLLWHRPATPPEEIVQLPFVFTRTMVASTVKLDVRWYKEWTSHPDTVGLVLPKGSDIQILQISFVGLSPLEKTAALLRSYWTFDKFSPYSVNFLWGPILTMSPIARESLYVELPPHGTYANVLWYLLLFGIAIGCIAWGWKELSRRNAFLCMAVCIGALWLLSDLRMGLEAVSYARTDLTEYWTQPASERKFRERGDFPVFLSAIQPLLTDRGRYIFLTQFEYPLLGLMRYHTYPSIPVAPEKATEGIDTWVIYERPEISVDAEGRLTAEGKPISLPGTVLFEFRSGAFVFRTH
ncbi:MAG: hypothetical protein Greene101449_1014 [Candidatus Peregrinibacteria bacterium Greene1014_49]|nr:MAG: hypothetical protein Greene101449_1014 [Candidatus Peregrinibacteria bacterium Greene1014_49]